MTVKPIMRRYGQSAFILDTSDKSTVKFNAFVQALRYKNKLYLRGTFTELGRNQQDYYLYIGPPDIDIGIVDGDTKTLTVSETQYIVDRVEKHYIGNQLIYIWGILHPTVNDM